MLSVGPGCESKGIVLHEICHALGFYHVQSRTDRDEYIRIEWQNIRQGELLSPCCPVKSNFFSFTGPS